MIDDKLYEAPASVTVKFHLRGFDTMLTLRDFSGADLLPKLTAALSALEKMGAQPTANSRHNGSGPTTNGAAPDCPTHDRPMKPSKHGSGWYCPVKIADDDGTGKPVYCRQKVK